MSKRQQEGVYAILGCYKLHLLGACCLQHSDCAIHLTDSLFSLRLVFANLRPSKMQHTQVHPYVHMQHSMPGHELACAHICRDVLKKAKLSSLRWVELLTRLLC